ncbi:hypothetical protein [Streptomyces sp. E2N166]|uniref:hypothetical protein n=1 Tax=Streptomyces sp. E2N166 TaxID=1851909 RepID=UPI001EE7BFB1|nr:hypothetical protein [Streptomyces sp. E2N166]
MRALARILINEIEGTCSSPPPARRDGRPPHAPFDWPTAHQRAEVERRFEAEYPVLARGSWQRTAERAERPRGGYERRYRALRRRMLIGSLVGWCAVLGCAGALALALA